MHCHIYLTSESQSCQNEFDETDKDFLLSHTSSSHIVNYIVDLPLIDPNQGLRIDLRKQLIRISFQ